MTIKKETLNAILDVMFSDVTPAMLCELYPTVTRVSDMPQVDGFRGGDATLYSFGDPAGVRASLFVPVEYELSSRGAAALFEKVFEYARATFSDVIREALDTNAMKSCLLSQRVLTQWQSEQPMPTTVEQIKTIQIITVISYKDDERYSSMEVAYIPKSAFATDSILTTETTNGSIH